MTLLDAPLELLHEPPGLPAFDLPDELRAAYRGTLGFGAPRTFANFVATRRRRDRDPVGAAVEHG